MQRYLSLKKVFFFIIAATLSSSSLAQTVHYSNPGTLKPAAYDTLIILNTPIEADRYLVLRYRDLAGWAQIQLWNKPTTDYYGIPLRPGSSVSQSAKSGLFATDKFSIQSLMYDSVSISQLIIYSYKEDPSSMRAAASANYSSSIHKIYSSAISLSSGNKNAESVGFALDRIAHAHLLGNSTPIQDQLLSTAPIPTGAGISSYAQSIAGEIYPATVTVIAQSTQRLQQAILNRLDENEGINVASLSTRQRSNTALTTNPSHAADSSSRKVHSNSAVNSSQEVRTFSNGNVWGDLVYQRGNRSSDSSSGGWNSNLYQLVFGSDFYSADGYKVGGGFALSNTTLKPNYGSGTIQQGSVFAYGKIPVQEYQLDAIGSFGLNFSDISRSDITGLSNGFRNKNISGNDAMVSIGISRPFNTEQLTVSPYARVTWQLVTQSAINEGDAASALRVKSFSGNGVRGVLGVSSGSKNTEPMTRQFTYRAYLGVGVDSPGLLNPTLNASIAGIGTNITTPSVGSTFIQAGLFGTAKIADQAYAFLGVSGEARSGQTLGAINAGISIQF